MSVYTEFHAKNEITFMQLPISSDVMSTKKRAYECVYSCALFLVAYFVTLNCKNDYLVKVPS